MEFGPAIDSFRSWLLSFFFFFNAYADRMVWLFSDMKEFIQERKMYPTFVPGIEEDKSFCLSTDCSTFVPSLFIQQKG